MAHKIYLKAEKTEKVSVCLTFMGLMKYLCDPETYKSSLLLLEDARFLAQDTQGENAWGISKWAFAQIAIQAKKIIRKPCSTLTVQPQWLPNIRIF